MTHLEAMIKAAELIGAETNTQNKMWGDVNDRADHTKGQLLAAACASATAVLNAETYPPREEAFEVAKENYYPTDWSGFRDYGSDIANLVVAAAFLQNEIKRRLMNGESYERSKRRADQPYNPETGLPNEAA